MKSLHVHLLLPERSSERIQKIYKRQDTYGIVSAFQNRKHKRDTVSNLLNRHIFCSPNVSLMLSHRLRCVATVTNIG